MVASRKFTDPVIKNLTAPETGQADYWDSLLPGFGLRVSYGGRKSWMIHTRALQKGQWKATRVTFDRYPALSLAEARTEARRLLELAEDGKDPRKAKRAAVKEEREQASRDNYKAVVKDFLIRYRTRQKKRPSPRTLQELKRALNHDAFKDWQDRPTKDISKRDIQDAIECFMAKGHERAANAYLRYLKMLFGWALDREIIDTDPTARIKPPGEEKSRERVLTDDEINAIWKTTANTGDLFPSIVRVLLLTGQRRSEVGGMRWSEVDLDAAMWSLPGERTKNGRDHLVPLSAPVAQIIEQQKQLQAARRMKTDFVFTSAGKAPFSGWSKSKSRLDVSLTGLAEDDAVLTPWTLHDLRRSAVTKLHEDLHIQPHIVEAIVNHVSGAKAGVAGTYNRAIYLDERRRALNAWADYVMSLAAGKPADNVVRMG